MSKEIERSVKGERAMLPIERGFPIERVNEIAEKEGKAKMHHRPIYTMHKWWARRLGCVFRTISLYSLLDDSEQVSVHEPGQNGSLADFGAGTNRLQELIENVDISDPESLWELYPKDVRIKDKKILDPFMGGGTSLVEASRFGVESKGYDLNPVAWFVTKKEIEAGQTDITELETAFKRVKDDVADEITRYYRTPCPNAEIREDKTVETDDPLNLDAEFEYHVSSDLRDELVVPDHYADVMYNFWVKELNCVDCGSTVPLFKDYRIAKGRYENGDEYNVLCPECESVVLVDDWQSNSTCSECDYEWKPKQGTVSGAKYACPDCGAEYAITDAVQEQDGFELRLYAVEYYCETCDDLGRSRDEVKGYKTAGAFDKASFEVSEQEWEAKDDLHEYIPSGEIPSGHMVSERNPVFEHGYREWKDFFHTRQLLNLSKLLKSIDNMENQNNKEYLLLTLSGILRTNTLMVGYDHSRNGVVNIFKSNSYDPPHTPCEGNIWGAKYGRGTFCSIWDMVTNGVEYANAPTDRYYNDGEMIETPKYDQPIGEDSEVFQGDMRTIDSENEYDAVITDPPYYDNIIYSEVADYFYVWQKILLSDEYECFQYEKTPRAESIVTNPFYDKTEEDFESDLHEAFTVIHRALKEEGVLTFTYHHSDSESWGGLLTALCDVGFEVTATYPISADNNKFISGEAVEFDIVIVARPASDRQPISWNSLRRNIYRTAQTTRKRLEENRDLSRGDIGVVEMGRCFHEYSKHHGKVERAGETMTAKEVVDEIYGVIQHGSDIGEIDVFLDLLETPNASYDDLNKLCRGTNATPERMVDMRLYRMDNSFQLGTWDDEKRMEYIQRRVENDEELTDLDRAQFLRYRWEHGKSVSEYLNEWEISDDLRELCEGLADATGDDTYRNILESRLSDF